MNSNPMVDGIHHIFKIVTVWKKKTTCTCDDVSEGKQ